MEKQAAAGRYVPEIPGVGSVYRFLKDNLGILIGLAALMLLLTLITDKFMQINNWINVLRTISTNLFLSAGVMLTIVIGGIDLSGGMTLAMSGVVTGYFLVELHMDLPLSVLLGCMSGLAIGLLNGGILAFTNMPPFIVTLATQNIAKGAAYLISNGTPFRVENEIFEQIGLGYLWGVPLPVIYSLVLLLIMYYLMNKTRLGSHMYAIGGNRQAAVFSGINVRRTTIIVYALSGLFAGVAGVVLAGRMGSGQPSVGVGYEGDAIAAVVLGGASMMGGTGKVGGMLLGALLIGILSNGLNLLNINSFWQYVAKGVVIIAAVYIDSLRKK